MLRHTLFLAGITLAIGTLAAYFPYGVMGGLIGVSSLMLLWRWPLYGLLGLILATLLGEFARITIGSMAILPLDLLTPLIVGVWALKKLVYRIDIRIPPGGLWLMGFWLIAGLSLLMGSTVLTGDELLKAGMYLIRFIAGSGLYILCYNLTYAEVRYTMHTLLATCTLLAISGFIILQLIPDFAAAGLAALGWDPHIGRLTSTWLDPNFAGGALAFGLALIGGMFTATRNNWHRLLQGGMASTLLIALLLTFSRSGLLAFAVAGLILGLLRSRTALLIGMLVAIIGIMGSTRLQERLGEFATSIVSIGTETMQTLDPTAALRVDSWREAFRIWENAPLLGVGFGTYAAHQSFAGADSHAATGADSSLLTLGATTGIVGVMLFLGFLTRLFLTLWLHRHEPLAGSFLAGGAGLLVHAIFVNSLLYPPLTIYFFVLAGAAMQGAAHNRYDMTNHPHASYAQKTS